jgi:hypothetical protein
VNHYYGTGCYGCGGWNAAGAAAVGLAAGAAIGSANANAQAANAYAAGVAVGSATAIGSIETTLPPACTYTPQGGASYYNCSGTWLMPAYGANGVFYRVVAPPS